MANELLVVDLTELRFQFENSSAAAFSNYMSELLKGESAATVGCFFGCQEPAKHIAVHPRTRKNVSVCQSCKNYEIDYLPSLRRMK